MTSTRSSAAFALFCLGAAAAGCGRTRAADADATSQPADRGARAPQTVHLSAAQLAQIRVDEISVGAPAQAIHATGTVEFDADRVARILPPVAGQVRELTANVGDTVHEGETLFVLSSREVAAAIADHVAAHKDRDIAEKTFAMTQDLFEHQAASRMSFQQAENDLAKARSKVMQTEEVLRVFGLDVDSFEDLFRLQSRIPIVAPISGTITERPVTNGQFVAPDTTLLVIGDLSKVWVVADVFERDLHSIAAGQKADVTTAAYPNERFSAEVARIGSVVDAQTRTAKVRCLVANPGVRLKPGMFASANLYLPDAAPALTVPAGGVFVEGGRSYVYLRMREGEFARHEVETAASSPGRLRVVRGLSAGDRVVSEGVLLLRQFDTDGPSQ